jgi:hypothetical protein
MNKVCLFVLFAMITTFSACVGDNNTAEAAFDRSALDVPRSEAEIFEIISNIQETKDTMQQRGPLTVIRENANIEVTGYMRDDTPVLVYAQYPSKQEWYFLKDQRVIMLKELIFQMPDTSLVTENQFFYNATDLLGKRTRNAPGLDSLKNVSFKPLELAADDYRFQVDQANQSAIDFIYGK